MQIAPLDIVFAVILIFMAFRVALRGFVAEIMSFAALLLGIGAAIIFSNTLAAYISQYIGESVWNPVIAFLVIFLLVYFLLKMFENALHRMLDNIHLDKLDRALGFFLGIGEGILLVSVLIFLMSVQTFFDVSGLLEDSFFAKVLLPVIPYLKETFIRGSESVSHV